MLKSFSLTHENPDVFITSFWQPDKVCNMYYLVYKWIMALFLLICWLLSVIDEKHLHESATYRLKWLIYLTHWGFTVCCVEALLCSLMLTERIVSIRRKGEMSKNDWTLKVYKFYWVSFTIALDYAFLISILYWAVIYSKESNVTYLTIMMHIVNSVCMFIEFLVVGHPLKIGHFYIPLIFSLIYTIFNIIYYFAGGTTESGQRYIYKVSDWSKPKLAFTTIFAAIIFVCCIHVLFCFLYRFKVCLKNRKKTNNNATPSENNPTTV